MTGGGYLEARPLYCNQIEFMPEYLVFFETNTMPEFDPTDKALFERLIRLEFPLSYVENPTRDYERKIDLQLPEKLKNESEGILNWLIKGCLEYQRAGLNIPESLRELNEAYKNLNNNVPDFIKQHCVVGNSNRIRTNQLYSIYTACGYKHNDEVLSKSQFYREIENLGFRRTPNKREFIGISAV